MRLGHLRVAAFIGMSLTLSGCWLSGAGIDTTAQPTTTTVPVATTSVVVEREVLSESFPTTSTVPTTVPATVPVTTTVAPATTTTTTVPVTTTVAPATTTTAQVPAVPTTGDYSLADVEAADPEVVFADGFHYLYATNVATPFGVFVHLPTWRSEDLMEWEWVGNTMPELGPWAEAGNTWAPGVIQVGDLWIAYYTARVAGTTADPAFPAGEQCIGIAVADSPEGPFVDSSDAPLVCQHELGGSIDASPYRDADGSLWLTYKSDSNAPHVGGTARLFSQQLSSDGLELVGSPNQLVVADQAWEMPLIENPDFVRGPDGNLWLSYSAAWWGDSSYKTGLAQCDSPAGGCTKGGPWISTDAALTGPGGLSFFDHDGVTVAALHSWNAGVTFDEGGFRQLAVASVDWS